MLQVPADKGVLITAVPLHDDGHRFRAENYFFNDTPIKSLTKAPVELAVGVKFKPAPAGYQLFTVVHIDGDNIVWTSPYGTALSAGVTLRPTVEKWLREFPVDQLS